MPLIPPWLPDILIAMLDDAASAFRAVLGPAWSQELAGILPLSALIDFVDVPRILHIFQLTGLIPLWCWPITPSGSRLLLAPDNEDTLGRHANKHNNNNHHSNNKNHGIDDAVINDLDDLDDDDDQHTKGNDLCCLDRFGSSLPLTCLDGRYGDMYQTPNPATLRLALQNIPVSRLPNAHPNMSRPDRRLQTLQLVSVSRMGYEGKLRRARLFVAANAAGWALWAGLVALSAIMGLWLALAFLVSVPAAGVLVAVLHGGGRPRSLGKRASRGSDFNRVVVAAQHMNENEWFVFYGESSVVNALLNLAILPDRAIPDDDGDRGMKKEKKKKGSALGKIATKTARLLLRGVIGIQWAMAVGSAAVKGWDAYVVTFWIVFCIMAHALAFSPEQGARSWLKHFAGVRLRRYRVGLSSRRAMLGAVAALNPDTFAAMRPTAPPPPPPPPPAHGGAISAAATGQTGAAAEKKPGFAASATTTSPSAAAPAAAWTTDYSKLADSGMLWIDPILKRNADRTRWEESLRRGIAASAAAKQKAGEAADGSSSAEEDGSWREEIKGLYWGDGVLESIEVAERLTREAGLGGRYVKDSVL